MNDVLELKGTFGQKPRPQNPPIPTLPTKGSVTASHLEKLKSELQNLESFWETQSIIKDALISVYYIKIASKSNRIGCLLSKGKATNDSIVGAKFSEEIGKEKHIITHYVKVSAIQKSIEDLRQVIEVVKIEFDSFVDDNRFNMKIKGKPNPNELISKIDFGKYSIAKTRFQKIIVDAYYVKKFKVEENKFDFKKQSIVNIYDIQTDTKSLLESLGIHIFGNRIINETTILLDRRDLEILMDKVPYLIAMATEDLTTLMPSDFKQEKEKFDFEIPAPQNEPVIGVIDTLFNEDVYFNEWVEYDNRVDENIIEPKDYEHGTGVTSLIVDGPTLNPKYDDGCGRFRVKHFGVSKYNAFSSFGIIREIKTIVTQNPHIKVWNLSLGSNEEIHRDFISAEGAVLDQIQFENDVVFVIAGTNKLVDEKSKKIGAPADSINSVVVNSVDDHGTPARYTREGIVLSFFIKPDVTYYGGIEGDYMKVYQSNGVCEVAGTSYAAPWIARKLAYLIHIIGLNKELAKAILIDSAIGWKATSDPIQLGLTGHGIVPIKIDEMIKSQSDEIRFVVTGISEAFNTYNYNFPVPIVKGKHPYRAKATMCYFPKCVRSQGVDYTNTELDLRFGRIEDNGRLKTLNNNKQSPDDPGYMYEEDARKAFRKWDNVKHINEGWSLRGGAKKVYQSGMWGLEILTNDRLNTKDGEGLRFGVVVTLRAIDGKNRIEEFIQQCNLRGWLVNRINIKQQIDIYNLAHEEIEWE